MQSKTSYQGKVFLVVGESQKGKSSFIKDFTAVANIAVGAKGRGTSCTSEIRCYESVKHFPGAIFVDTVGLYGSDLITKQKLIQSLEWFLINGNLGKSIAGVILFDTYSGDSISVTKSIELVQQIFGKPIPSSIAVFLTKRRAAQNLPGHCQQRRDQAEQQAQLNGIPRKAIIDVQTTCSYFPTITNQQNQVAQISQVLSGLKPIQLLHIQQKLNKIEQRAQQMRLEGKTIGYQTVKYTIQVPKGGLPGLLGGKKNVDCQKVVSFDQYPPIDQCRFKAKQQYFEKVRSSLLTKEK